MKAKKFLFSHDLDKILAVIGIVFSIGLIIYLSLYTNRLLYVTVGILILISCLIWLFIRRKASLNKINLQSRSVYLLSNVLFFLFLACSILSIHFRTNLYERPPAEFLSPDKPSEDPNPEELAPEDLTLSDDST